MNKVSGINDIHNAPDMLDVNNAHHLSAAPDETDAGESHGANALEQHRLPPELARLFMQLSPQDIEQFYQSYQRWILEQQIEIQQSQIAALQQKMAQNAALMEQVRPSAIALSTLAQLQASGVEDIALLDQMLERGEAWLDRTMQQLAYCERMDLIGESYTAWCRHALEGAYDWIESIQEAEKTETSTAIAKESGPAETAEVTEDLLLQKLMSDDDTAKTLTLRPRITAPLPALDETSLEADDITARIATPPTDERVEAVAGVAAPPVETGKTAAATAAEPLEAAASFAETVSDTVTEVEPVEATAFENAATSSTQIEQESIEPVAQTEPEALAMIDLAINQTATDVELDEPDQEKLLDEIDQPDQEELSAEIAAPETVEDDSTLTDNEIVTDSPRADEVEEAELAAPAEAKAVPQNEDAETLAVAAIEPAMDEADILVDEATVDSASVATEVATPAGDAAPDISDTEDVSPTVEQEEQEAEETDAASDVELVKDEGVALSPVAEPPEEEISPPPVETDTPSDSVEAARPPQEQPPAPQPAKKPGFFRRLLAFLLS